MEKDLSQYPFRVLIDDSNYVNVGIPDEPYSQPFKSRRKSEKIKSRVSVRRKKKKPTQHIDISSVTSGCFSDSDLSSYCSSVSEQVALSESSSSSSEPSSSSASSYSESEASLAVSSESPIQEESDHSDCESSFSQRSCDNESNSSKASPKKISTKVKKALKKNHKLKANVKAFIFQRVEDEIQQLESKGFNVPSNYDPSSTSIRHKEATLLKLKLDQAKQANKKRINGFLKMSAVVLTLICKFAKVQAINVDGFMSDLKAEIAAGSFDDYIDLLEPSLKNHIITHPLVGIATKFVEVLSDSAEKKSVLQQKEQQKQKEAIARAQQQKRTQELMQKVQQEREQKANV